MNKCPHVKHVTLYADRSCKRYDTISWMYFSRVLIHCGVWKLRSLPKRLVAVHPRSLHKVQNYFDCAYYLKNTLVDLSIGTTYVGKFFWENNKFTRLKDFKKLKLYALSITLQE